MHLKILILAFNKKKINKKIFLLYEKDYEVEDMF